MRGALKHFVYFAKMPDGFIKIGCSTDVEKRVSALRGDLIFVIEGSTFRENALHFLLRSAHVRKELFEDGDVVRGFISRASAGDYSGLISDIPRTNLWAQPDPVRGSRRSVKPFREVREALGLSHKDVSEGAGVMLSTATVADTRTPPYWLSGRLSQFIIGKSREEGIELDTHHLTWMYERERKYLLDGIGTATAAA